MKNVKRRPLLPMLFFLIFVFSVISYGQTQVSLAVLPLENMNGIEDQNYLKGIINSILVEDLSGSGEVLVVERDRINDVLKEQQLQYTGLMDEKGAIKAGKLLGASMIIKGGYVFLGQDLFINETLIKVETGEARTFSERGYQENTVHALSEKILNHITGKAYSFQKSEGERSILATEQLETGTVELFSPIIKARVFMDDTFAGYTTGDSTKPLVLQVSPGKHKVRVHLSREFGVVDLPEVTLHDWEREFNLMPGEKITLEDKTRHFSHILLEIRDLLRESVSLSIGEGQILKRDHSLKFTDREGTPIPVELDVLWEETAVPSKGGEAEISLRYQGEEYNFTYFASRGKDLDYKEEVGKIRLDVSLRCNSSYEYELRYSIRRTDIDPGMYRK